MRRTLLLGALALAMTGCMAQTEQELPPSPLQTTTYERTHGDHTHQDVKFYDATTGHTWWLVDDEVGRKVVLDTAGTEAI